MFPREQGLTGFFATGLDPYLRNTGVKNVIVTGVSLNIAVLGTTIEAMNLGYQAIVPSDCVASDPPEYAETLLRYTIRNIALVTDSAAHHRALELPARTLTTASVLDSPQLHRGARTARACRSADRGRCCRRGR